MNLVGNLAKEKKIADEINSLKAEIDVLKKTLSKNVINKKSGISIAQRMLLLDYLGILNSIDIDNKNKAAFLKYLFNNEGDENIRKNLSSISRLKTKSNLEFVSKVFQEVGLNEIQKRVQNDLEKAKL